MTGVEFVGILPDKQAASSQRIITHGISAISFKIGHLCILKFRNCLLFFATHRIIINSISIKHGTSCVLGFPSLAQETRNKLVGPCIIVS